MSFLRNMQKFKQIDNMESSGSNSRVRPRQYRDPLINAINIDDTSQRNSSLAAS